MNRRGSITKEYFDNSKVDKDWVKISRGHKRKSQLDYSKLQLRSFHNQNPLYQRISINTFNMNLMHRNRFSAKLPNIYQKQQVRLQKQHQSQSQKQKLLSMKKIVGQGLEQREMMSNMI